MRLVIAFGLVACLPSGSVCAPVPPRDERKEQQHAVEAVQKLGGDVLYDYQRPNPDRPNEFEPDAKPKNPDAFHRVVRVNLRGTKADDDDLKVLALLPRLENLDLTDTRITGAGLAHLKGLKNLRVLDRRDRRRAEGSCPSQVALEARPLPNQGDRCRCRRIEEGATKLRHRLEELA